MQMDAMSGQGRRRTTLLWLKSGRWPGVKSHVSGGAVHFSFKWNVVLDFDLFFNGIGFSFQCKLAQELHDMIYKVYNVKSQNICFINHFYYANFYNPISLNKTEKH